ncbi:hypothetical protein [Microbacterium sp. IEGM 1404]|uniref:hypothetical protein n=1 Tax=Microbacterium sp. IEGM 1404 TaxID=3047084 RepID=UPI0024B810FB|nr:hypothetical protein [Microbacterium sp. IEGM 1404]MDI9891707.1 hypothetical protein [Microbacterium sp. IEGM 1404]
MAGRRTKEEWARLADAVVRDVAARELAFGARELEAKAADRPWGEFPTIQPHLLTPAAARLRREGVISYEGAATRGGGVQRVFVTAEPSKAAARVAGRKRLLLARYRTWATPGRDWNPSPVGSALERVVHASLLETAPYGYRLLNPSGGEVRDLLGARVPGGPLDSAAWLLRLDANGMPMRPVLTMIEAKNLREWIYPRTQELYQLLDKAASVQVAHPDIPIVPILVCRRLNFITGAMAKQVGMHLIETKTQFVRPVVLNVDDGQRKVDEVVNELGYDVTLNDEATPAMKRQFETTLPSRVDEAAERWRLVALHPEVPDVLSVLRDEEVLGDERTRARDEFARCVQEATGEDAIWASADLD